MSATVLSVQFSDGIGAGYCSIYTLADDCRVSLVPTTEGTAWMDSARRCFYNASLPLGAQAAVVTAVLAFDQCPSNALSRAILRRAMLSRCLETLGPELAEVSVLGASDER